VVGSVLATDAAAGLREARFFRPPYQADTDIEDASPKE
jgi:hypothetical protein